MRLLILPVPLIVAACSETKLPAVDPTVSSERVLSSLTGPDSSWNHISVDITVRREGDARHKPFRSRPATQFRLEKTLADAGWTTQVTMVGKLRTAGDSATISSVVFDPQGSIARAFDAYGREVKVPKASHARMSYAEFGTLIGSVSTKGATAAAASLTARAQPSKVARPAASITDKNRIWIDQLVVTPGARTRALNRLQRRYGTPIQSIGNEDVFRFEKASQSYEEVFDHSIGAVVRQIYTDAGGKVVKTVRRFSATSDGRFVLYQVITDFPRPDGGSERLIQELKNLKVEAR